MMSIRMKRWASCLLSGVMCLLSSSPALADNSATGNFKAVIQPGTCSVTLNGGQASADVDLKSVYIGNVNTGTPLLSSDDEPQTLDINCPGYPSKQSKPSLTVSGNAIGTGSTSSASLFRDAGAGAGNNNPSKSLGFQVQADQAGTVPPTWNAVPFMTKDAGYQVMATGSNVNSASIPVRFTMFCAPQNGNAVADCQQAGSVKASLTFTFDYE
ncbi:TPA: type 1 fimbrial protein [Serratia liquefaciens]|nr:type 1 fimbrial protein [Serratia liquefaciens]